MTSICISVTQILLTSYSSSFDNTRVGEQDDGIDEDHGDDDNENQDENDNDDGFKLHSDTVFELLDPGIYVGLRTPENALETFYIAEVIQKGANSK